MASFGEGHVHPRVLEIDHHRHQYEKNALIRCYHIGILREAVKISDVRPGMTVLDYGCGHQLLATQLPEGVEYVGYDLLPELTSIKDPRTRLYDHLFCIQVAHLLHEKALDELFAMFAEVAPRCTLMIPHQGRLKRALDRLFGQRALVRMTFATGFPQIQAAAQRDFQLVCRKVHLSVADFSVWERKRKAGGR